MKTRTSWIGILAVGIVLGAANWTPAVGTSYWTGKAGEQWHNPSSWSAGVVDTSSEIAAFGTGRVTQPRLFTNYDIGALRFYNSGWEIREAGSRSLTLRAATAIHCAINTGTTYIYSDIWLGSNQEWYVGTNSTLHMAGSIARSYDLTKNGLGILYLRAANTFGGTMTVAAGTLRMGHSAALPTSTDVTVEGGALLDLNGRSASIDALDGSGSVELDTDILTVGNSNGGGTFSGVISGTGQLHKYGSGTQTLSGANTYAGPTKVYGGTLALGGAGESLPDSTDLYIATGATFDLNGRMEKIDALTGDGEVVTDGGRLSVGQFGGGGTFSGVISGAGEFRKYGSGTQTLTGNNSYTGPTNIYGGMLAVSSASYRLPASTDVYVAGGATFYLNGFDEQINDLTGGGVVTVLGGMLSVGGGGTFEGVINGTGDLTKGGSTALTLSGMNEYIGTTTVDGTLIVDGSIASSSLTTVNDGGTLGGSGTVGPVELYGTASPGTSAGILTVEGDLTMNAGLIQIELGGLLAGDGYDRLVVTGLLALDGNLDVFLIDGFEPAAWNTFDILNWGSLTGTFDNQNLPGLGPGLMWDTSDLYTRGELRVGQLPAPEPAGLGLIGLALLAVRKRRR